MFANSPFGSFSGEMMLQYQVMVENINVRNDEDSARVGANDDG